YRRCDGALGISLPLALPHARHDAGSGRQSRSAIMMNLAKKKWRIALSLGLGTLAVAHAHAAEPDASNIAGHSHAVEHAPEIFTKVMLDQLEIRDGEDGNPLVLEGQAWIGSDL